MVVDVHALPAGYLFPDAGRDESADRFTNVPQASLDIAEDQMTSAYRDVLVFDDLLWDAVARRM